MVPFRRTVSNKCLCPQRGLPVQGGQKESVISVYSHSHSFLLWFDLFGFCFLLFSSQCLSPGFLSGCSLPCVGDGLARHNAWLRNVALSVSRPAVAKWRRVCQSQHLSLVSAAGEQSPWPHLLPSTLLPLVPLAEQALGTARDLQRLQREKKR